MEKHIVLEKLASIRSYKYNSSNQLFFSLLQIETMTGNLVDQRRFFFFERGGGGSGMMPDIKLMLFYNVKQQPVAQYVKLTLTPYIIKQSSVEEYLTVLMQDKH